MEDSAVKQGQLSYRIKGSFGKKYKDHYVVLIGSSRSGLARLEMFEPSKGTRANKYILVLVGSDVIKVVQEEPFLENKGRGFTVTTREQQHNFLAKDEKESSKWVKAIQETLLGSAATRLPLSQATAPSHVMEENDIYMSSEEARSDFTAEVEGETRMKLKVEGPVRVMVGSGNITIVTKEGKRVVRWAISNLRKIGFTYDNFHLEVGRKSEFGPGVFIFNTTQGRGIHRLVNQEKEYVRQQIMKARNPNNAAQRNQNQAMSPTLPAMPPLTRQAPVHASTPSPEPLTVGSHIYDSFENLRGQDRSSPKVSSIHSVSSLDAQPRAMRHDRSLDGRKSSESLDSLSPRVNKSNKSHPTKLAARSADAWRDKALRTPADSLQPQDHIYSQPEEMRNAWRTHGYGSEDHLEWQDDRNYDVLNFHRPMEKKDRRHLPKADSYEESGAAAVSEGLYAKVNLDAKRNPRGAKSFDYNP